MGTPSSRPRTSSGGRVVRSAVARDFKIKQAGSKHLGGCGGAGRGRWF